MSHTKGLLKVFEKDPTFIRTSEGRKRVGSTSSMGETETDEANARRLVACWNACAGIETDVLEVTPSLEDVWNDVTKQRDEHRDGRLAALEKLASAEKQVEGLINQLSAHQRQAAIGKAIERACEELPEGFDLHVECEKDTGTVRLYHPDGEEDDTEFHDSDYFSGAIDNAINVAIAKGGTS